MQTHTPPRQVSLHKILYCLSVICLTVITVSGAARAQNANVPRPEYPRPDFVRPEWQTLNGTWEFDFDDANKGIAEGWYKGDKRLSRTIQVPFAFQAKLSGIGDTSFHDTVWYRRQVAIPDSFRAGGKRVMLNFGAVDYETQVWINGAQAGAHRGGNIGFALDITPYLKAGENVIVVRAFDPSEDRTIPRGKQYWKPKSEIIWYTRTSGIWQSVWLETVAPVHIKRLRVTPDVDNSQVAIETVLSDEALINKAASDLRVRVALRFDKQERGRSEIAVTNTADGSRPVMLIKLHNQQLWSPERPALYDLTIELIGANGQVVDKVESYFGQRKVSHHDGRIYLNNEPYYLKMILDQGYWQDGILTPPSDEAMQYDIRMTKAFGFNGSRKHQKVEDPRWLYHCDKMGLIVWGEMANAFDIYTDDYVARFTEEWQQAVERDYNHPSIIAWTPINESWGVTRILTDKQQQAHVKALYYLTHSLDSTRLVSDNDGWEHTDATDIFGIHDYARTGDEFAAKYKILETDRTNIPRNGREALAFGYKYNNTPIVLTEFGGIAYRFNDQRVANEFGYGNTEPTKEAFMNRLDGLVRAVRANRAIAGYCYTQLTDVEQEINGLMTYDRKPKATPQEFARIFSQ